MELIRAIEAEQLRSDIPDFKIGDTVKVMVKVVEGTRERLRDRIGKAAKVKEIQ